MEELNKQVGRARLRLGLRRFAGALGWCWFATLLVALGLIIVDRFYPLGPSAWGWALEPVGLGPWAAALGWALGALLLGLIAAVLWTVLTRREPLGAAIEIDRRYGLKERVSSSTALLPEDRQTEAGQALIADAVRRVRRIHVSDRFPAAPPRQFLLPLLPAVVAVLVAVLFDPAEAGKLDTPQPDAAAVSKQVKKATNTLRRRLAERRKQAEKMGLKDAEELIKKLEEGTKELADRKTERKQALAKLNDQTREIERRRKQLGNAKKLQEQLNQLKNVDQGPAKEFAKALARRDFQQAIDQLQKLKDQLANSDLGDEQKEELARQLDRMQQNLNQLAEAHRAAQNDLKQRVDQLRQAGELAEADKLQQQLEKLLGQLPQIEQLEQLADTLGQCAKGLRDGQLQDAMDAMDNLQIDINALQNQLDELDMLDDLMKQLAQARDQMNQCPMCGGAGCEACQGDKPGFGMGAGRGLGARPEAEDDVSFYDSRVRQKTDKGTFVITDLVHGPNAKGKVEEEIHTQFDAARRGSTDPLTRRRIPRDHRQHTREYFDSFRKGEPGK